MPLRGGRNWKKPGPYDRKIPGVLIRPDREPRKRGTTADYEWSTWVGATRRHFRLTTGRGVALCGSSPGGMVSDAKLRQRGDKRPLCKLCVRMCDLRGVEVPK